MSAFDTKADHPESVLVPVMHVGKVRMRVRHNLMYMPMRMLGARCNMVTMRMLVMFIMHMFVLMQQHVMRMLMSMCFSEV
jgi:hypothetical protein